MLTENLRLKVFSLLLAVLLEIYFYSPDNSVIATLSANVEVRNVPANQMIISPPGAEKGMFARVLVRGPSPLVEQVRTSVQRFVVEVPDDVSSTFVKSLSRGQLRLPTGLDVLEIDPPKVELQFEPIVRKELLVIVDKVGDPAAGYRLDGLKVSPETVFARGPQGELQGLGIIETQKVDISNLKSSQRFVVSLIDKGKMTALDVNVVSVEATISPLTSEKTFDHQPITVLGPNGFAASVEPSYASVTIGGATRLLEELARTGLDLTADARSFAEGRYQIDLTLQLPEGVRVLQKTPEKVTVNLVRN